MHYILYIIYYILYIIYYILRKLKATKIHRIHMHNRRKYIVHVIFSGWNKCPGQDSIS